MTATTCRTALGTGSRACEMICRTEDQRRMAVDLVREDLATTANPHYWATELNIPAHKVRSFLRKLRRLGVLQIAPAPLGIRYVDPDTKALVLDYGPRWSDLVREVALSQQEPAEALKHRAQLINDVRRLKQKLHETEQDCLRLTTHLTSHPDWYEGICDCQECIANLPMECMGCHEPFAANDLDDSQRCRSCRTHGAP